MEYGTDPVWLSTVAQTVGTICFQLYNDADEALEYLQQSLHYNPENIEAIATIADIYFETRQMELAISAYKAILHIDPENADCYSNIGYILWQMDQNEAAIDAYIAAIHYNKDNYVAHNNLGVIYLDDEKNPQKALPFFRRALNLKQDYTLACFNIARALEGMDRRLESADAYSLALQLNQSNPELEDYEIQSRLDALFD